MAAATCSCEHSSARGHVPLTIEPALAACVHCTDVVVWGDRGGMGNFFASNHCTGVSWPKFVFGPFIPILNARGAPPGFRLVRPESSQLAPQELREVTGEAGGFGDEGAFEGGEAVDELEADFAGGAEQAVLL